MLPSLPLLQREVLDIDQSIPCNRRGAKRGRNTQEAIDLEADANTMNPERAMQTKGPRYSIDHDASITIDSAVQQLQSVLSEQQDTIEWVFIADFHGGVQGTAKVLSRAFSAAGVDVRELISKENWQADNECGHIAMQLVGDIFSSLTAGGTFANPVSADDDKKGQFAAWRNAAVRQVNRHICMSALRRLACNTHDDADIMVIEHHIPEVRGGVVQWYNDLGSSDTRQREMPAKTRTWLTQPAALKTKDLPNKQRPSTIVASANLDCTRDLRNIDFYAATREAVLNRRRNRQQGINSTESAMKAATNTLVIGPYHHVLSQIASDAANTSLALPWRAYILNIAMTRSGGHWIPIVIKFARHSQPTTRTDPPCECSKCQAHLSEDCGAAYQCMGCKLAVCGACAEPDGDGGLMGCTTCGCALVGVVGSASVGV
jgi:hypothetical protein